MGVLTEIITKLLANRVALHDPLQPRSFERHHHSHDYSTPVITSFGIDDKEVMFDVKPRFALSHVRARPALTSQT